MPDSHQDHFTRPWWSNGSAKAESSSYMSRKDLLRNCHSLLPQQTLVEPGPNICTDVLPKGWLCLFCGKLNHQTLFRHRKCFSSACQVCKHYHLLNQCEAYGRAVTSARANGYSWVRNIFGLCSGPSSICTVGGPD